MLGSIIGAGVGAAASVFGGISASKAIRKMKATQRADAQRILTKTEEAFRNRNRAAQGAAAVMGGTEESVASTKAANSQALADATSQIAVNAEARKDQIEKT